MTLERLRQTIRRQGHDLVHAAEVHDDPERLFEADFELIAAAGGDGTVATAARMLAGRRIPLAILPTGTANNIARSIGVGSDLDQLIRRWHTARRVPFDVGMLEGAVGEERFVEAIGCGLVPSAIDFVESEGSTEDQPTTSPVSQALRRYLQVLSQLAPEPWTVVVDGVRQTGEFLLVEVLNTPSIGPNLMLSTEADPSDGMFSVVMAAEHERAALARYLRCRLAAEHCLVSLPTLRGRRVVLEGAGKIHVDDQLTAARGTLSMRVDPAALDVLV